MADESSSSCTNSRWSQWFATLVFAIIALVSLSTSWTGNVGEQPRHDQWAFSALVVALCLSGLSVMAHVAKEKFVGTTIEVGMAFVVMCIMAAALPAIMKPGNNVAVGANGGIVNANLYFFSWGTFFMALFVFMHFVQNVYNVGFGTKNLKFDKVLWVVLIATSLIAMSSATRLWKLNDCANMDTSPCRRLEYAFSLGVVSGVLSFLWLLIGARCHVMFDAFLSVVMLILWCFAVAYTTFGDKAPGSNLGNLYFSTWFSFIISCRLTSAGMLNVMSSWSEGENADSKDHDAPKDEEGKKEGDDDDKKEGAEDKKEATKAGEGDEEEGGASHDA